MHFKVIFLSLHQRLEMYIVSHYTDSTKVIIQEVLQRQTCQTKALACT